MPPQQKQLEQPDTTASKTMFASVCTRYGPAGDVFELREDLPRPTLEKDDDVLVKVEMTTVNPADCKQRSGNLQLVSKHEFPLVLGQDFCGTVVATGAGATHLRVGDTVLGSTAPRNSCSAEYLVAKSHECAGIDLGGLSPQMAAAAPTAYCTAWKGLDYLPGLLPRGDKNLDDVANADVANATRARVLVIGASGSVGSAAVQLAAGLGSAETVVAVCSGDNLAYVESLATDTTQVIAFDYREPSYQSKILGSHKFDLVLDCVGGDDYYHAFHKCLDFANPRALYVTCVGPVRHGGSEPITIGTLLSTMGTLVPRLLGNYLLWGRRNSRYRIYLGFDTVPLPGVASALEAGTIAPRIDPCSPVPLRELGKAHSIVETGHSSGKVVVEIRKD